MKKRIYIETSIPSYYFEIRTDPEIIAKKMWSKNWWDNKSIEYDLYTSIAVLVELEKGDFPTKEACLNLIKNLPILPINSEIEEIVETYITRNVMPKDPAGDALHLAIASYHQCDFLLTWNCSHLANANKFHHIQVINTLMGLYNPALITPLELIEEDI